MVSVSLFVQNGRLLLDYIAFGGHTIMEAGPRRIDTAAAEAQAEMNRQ